MPIKVSQVSSRVKTVKKRFEDGQDMTVVYRPHVQTVDEQLEFEAQFNADDATLSDRYRLLIDWILLHIQSWDVMGIDEQPIPLTPDALKELPFDLLNFVFQTVTEDKTGGKGLRTR